MFIMRFLHQIIQFEMLNISTGITVSPAIDHGFGCFECVFYIVRGFLSNIAPVSFNFSMLSFSFSPLFWGVVAPFVPIFRMSCVECDEKTVNSFRGFYCVLLKENQNQPTINMQKPQYVTSTHSVSFYSSFTPNCNKTTTTTMRKHYIPPHFERLIRDCGKNEVQNWSKMFSSHLKLKWIDINSKHWAVNRILSTFRSFLHLWLNISECWSWKFAMHKRNGLFSFELKANLF